MTICESFGINRRSEKSLTSAGLTTVACACVLLSGCLSGQVAPRSTYAPPANYGPTSGVSTAGAPPGPVTSHYYDPNVMPAGAVDSAAPPQSSSPYDAPPSPAGPPPGYTGPTPQGPIVVSPISANTKADDDNEWDVSHLSPEYSWKEFKTAVGWGPDEKLANEAFNRGKDFFNQKKFEEAAKEFYTGHLALADSTLEEEAMFLMGESYFFSDNYGRAQDSYTNLLKQHVNTRYLDTVAARLFAIGTYWEQLDLKIHHWPLTPNITDKMQPTFDTIGNALACYSQVWINDPTGPLADAALFRAGNAYFRQGGWEEAAEKYDMLRKEHPRSKYQKDAHLLELQAKLKMYQGPLFSVVPLKDAQEIGEQTLRQFPGQLGDEEPRVRETMGRMAEMFAEREWAVGQYYDNKAEYRAAREYYKALVQKYPRTALAQRAQVRMDEIKNFPDEPANHFKWLTDSFGDKR